jgi:hypothetical protein
MERSGLMEQAVIFFGTGGVSPDQRSQLTSPMLRTGHKPIAFGLARPGKLKSRAESVAILASASSEADQWTTLCGRS